MIYDWEPQLIRGHSDYSSHSGFLLTLNRLISVKMFLHTLDGVPPTLCRNILIQDKYNSDQEKHTEGIESTRRNLGLPTPTEASVVVAAPTNAPEAECGDLAANIWFGVYQDVAKSLLGQHAHSGVTVELMDAAMVYFYWVVTDNQGFSHGRCGRNGFAAFLRKHNRGVRKQTLCSVWKFCLNIGVIKVADHSYYVGRYSKAYCLGPAHPAYRECETQGWDAAV